MIKVELTDARQDNYVYQKVCLHGTSEEMELAFSTSALEGAYFDGA